jgi:hypothetical protein
MKAALRIGFQVPCAHETERPGGIMGSFNHDVIIPGAAIGPVHPASSCQHYHGSGTFELRDSF